MQASTQQGYVEEMRRALTQDIEDAENVEARRTAQREGHTSAPPRHARTLLDRISMPAEELADLQDKSENEAREVQDVRNLINVRSMSMFFLRAARSAAGTDSSWRVQVLARAMTLTDHESQPVNEEAQRVLKFFMSTLLNTNMPRPTELDRMRSLTTLVPHYAEDVLYPIDADEVEHRTGKKPTAGAVTDLIGIMEGMEITTLQFLKIQFSDEWSNFVERLATDARFAERVAGVERKHINIGDFQRKNADGLFHDDDEARLALMKWASERGQLLWRTTKGMMLYAHALRLMAAVEAQDAMNQHSDAFVENKFRCAPRGRPPPRTLAASITIHAAERSHRECRHIVAAQVYGEKSEDSKGENKWIARSIDVLMKEYPSFRVAYMDKVKDHPVAGDKGVTHSVLLRWDEAADAPIEVYRVRLPWQTETKSGVVRSPHPLPLWFRMW